MLLFLACTAPPPSEALPATVVEAVPTPGTPPVTCADLATLPVEGEHPDLVREALIEMQTLGELCLSEVRIGAESSLTGPVLTIQADQPRAGAMYGACRQLADQLELPAEPAWTHAQHAYEGFARHCEQESMLLRASILEVAHGLEPVDADASLLSVVPRKFFIPDLPTDYTPGVPFELEGDFFRVAFADTILVSAVREDTPDADFEVRATDLASGETLWVSEHRLDFWPEVETVLDGAAIWDRDTGRIWHATRAGLALIAAVDPQQIDALSSDDLGWWMVSGDLAYAYDPSAGTGAVLASAVGELHPTPDQVWSGGPFSVTGLHTHDTITSESMIFSGISGRRAFTPSWRGAWMSRSLSEHAQWELEAVGPETSYWPEHGARIAHRVLREPTARGIQFTVRSRTP